MFLHVSVNLFTWGGVCPIACWDTPPRSRGRHPQEQTPPGSRHTPHPLEQTPPRSRHPPGADTPQHSAYWEIQATNGRYASYWNAILFSLVMGVGSRKFGLSLDFGSNSGCGSIRKLLQAHPVGYSGGSRFLMGAPKSANRSCGLKVKKKTNTCVKCVI